jgi:hypothetical protein
VRAAGVGGIELIRAEDLLHVRERGRQLLEGLRSTPADVRGLAAC